MTEQFNIPFNRPFVAGKESAYIGEALAAAHLASDGEFTRKGSRWLEARIGCSHALLTTSCTGALDLAAIVAGISPGDEVIMPSYTFVSTANAFVLRGAVPVFVDIREDTLNLDETLLEAAITDRTTAIVPVHYAGVSAEMDPILELARRRDLLVIEDAAQGVMSSYGSRALGSMGSLAALSFHETKNVTCGEGGALLINDGSMFAEAEVARVKGTNRAGFLRGEVERYTWVSAGSAYALSELGAAYLWAQLEEAESITSKRLAIWDRYHARFEELESEELVRRPVVPGHCTHNAHMYYLLLPDRAARDELIAGLATSFGIQAVFHYVPLHSSPAGSRFGRAHGGMAVTDGVSDRIVRLPLFTGMSDDEVDRVGDAVHSLLLGIGQQSALAARRS